MSSESPILSLRSIGKSFYGVTVLESIDLDIYPGEVHCLIGENGAGKSTLCKIIAGIYSADQGDMAFHGKIYALKSVKDGQKFGIGFIHQELMLVPQLTVLENIFLGKELRTFGNRMNWTAMHEQTQRIINELELDIKPDDLISDLSIAQQQMVEIAKAIFSEYKVIIFDEPTSSISHKNTETLFKIIHQLKAKGVAMIYISHRLEEFQYISDKVTVLRDGRVTGTMKYQETSVEEIVRLMVGHEISFSHYQHDMQFDQEKLRVENIQSQFVKPTSFSVYKGEIIGFAGFVGAGRTELLRAIYGADEASGRIFIDNLEVQIHNPQQAVANKIGFITEDRKQQGLVLDQSIRKNITLPILKRFWTGFKLDQNKEIQVAENHRRKLRIVSKDHQQPTRTLSGGNQQKVIIGVVIILAVFFDQVRRGTVSTSQLKRIFFRE